MRPWKDKVPWLRAPIKVTKLSSTLAEGRSDERASRAALVRISLSVGTGAEQKKSTVASNPVGSSISVWTVVSSSAGTLEEDQRWWPQEDSGNRTLDIWYRDCEVAQSDVVADTS